MLIVGFGAFISTFGGLLLATDFDIPEERAVMRALSFAGMVIIGCCLVAVFLGTFLIEELRLRRTALSRLGAHGIRKIGNDDNARLAYKGILLILKGNFVRAEELLKRALGQSDIRQNQLFCVEWLIRIYEAEDNTAGLLWGYRKAAELAPDNPEIQSRLGHAYYVEGKLDNAMYCFEQALRYDPNHGYSYYSIAKIYMVRGEDDKALETFDKLLKIQENHPLVYAELAVLHAMRGDEEKSREAYDKAILCGYAESDVLSKRVAAIFAFNKAEGVSGSDLPEEYYRKIEKDETHAGNV